jgi:hypothetical protein
VEILMTLEEKATVLIDKAYHEPHGWSVLRDYIVEFCHQVQSEERARIKFKVDKEWGHEFDSGTDIKWLKGWRDAHMTMSNFLHRSRVKEMENK